MAPAIRKEGVTCQTVATFFRRCRASRSSAGCSLRTLRGAAPKPGKRDYFKELNVRPFINAAGTFTTLTASLMRPEVVEAINYASATFVPLNDLQEAAGKRVAELIGCEAAMITSGAAAALTVGAAACVAGKNPDWIKRIPDLAGTGMKSEVISPEVAPLRLRPRRAQLRRQDGRGRDLRRTGEGCQ